MTVYWSDSNCANAFKIVFFRRYGDALKPFDERGPFSTTSNVMTVDVGAVSLEQGDLIGVMRIGDCGSPGTLSGVSTEGYLSYDFDVTGGLL